MNDRLELIWPYKKEVLLGMSPNGNPQWGTKDDLETRLLFQLKVVGQVKDDMPGNLYHQGDNLLALRSLEHHFAGKIQCIYIDPPFNTGNAFEHYDDGLEHSIWLSIMKPRLELLRTLLREDGTIFIHIDDNELGYLIALADEVFGRKNRISVVTFKQSSVSGPKTINPGFVTISNFVVVYAKNKSNWKSTKTYMKRSRNTRYNHYIVNIDDHYSEWQFSTIQQAFALVTGIPVRKQRAHFGEEFEAKLEEFVLEHADRIVRTARVAPKDIIAEARPLLEQSKSDRDTVYRYQRDGNFDYYFLRGEQLLFYSSRVIEIDGTLTTAQALSTIWDDLLSNNLANEGGVAFSNGKKPELLIKRCLDIATEEGDWVLDSFLGSGTTAAVALKMKRKWIGIEVGNNADTHCFPRLTSVVQGSDQSGATGATGWNGGGGFRYCTLGPSLFAKDDDTGLVMINPHYTNGPLTAAICNLEGFQLNNDSVFQGIREGVLAHITEEKVTQMYLDTILERLPDDKSLTIYCMKRSDYINLDDRVRLMRIPKELQIPQYLTKSQSIKR